MKKNFTLLFTLLLIMVVKYNTQAQTACNIFIQSSFNSDCISTVQIKGGVDPRFDHEETPCLLACSGSEVIYYAENLPENSICEWTISGAQTSDVSNDGTSVTVQWPNEAILGNIALQVTCSDSTICLTEVCIEVIEKPIAGIISNPMETEIINNMQHLYVCDGQTIEFYSNSTGSEDAPIVGYYWTDGQHSSSEQNFTFTASYSQYDRETRIYHKVINECGCYDVIIYYVHISEKSQLEVDCYGTICEDMLVTYATIDEGNESSCLNYLWTVVGGEIITGQSSNSVQVLWNDVDANGYGYIGIDNSVCEQDACPYLTYLPIPVIVDTVNILGPDTVCIGEWQIYEVPLWGSTLYSWTVNPNNNVIRSWDVTRNKCKLMFPRAGTYTINLGYENDFLECGGTARSKTVVVLDTFKILSDEKACQGSEITFTTDVGGNEIFLWKVYDNNNTLIFEYSGTSLTYTFTLAGSYSVSAYNENYCSAIRKGVAILELPPAPTPDATDWASKVCFGKGYLYKAENEPPYFLHWKAPNGSPTAFDGNEYNVTFSRAGNMTLQNVDPITGCLSLPYTFQIQRFIPNSLTNESFEVCANGISSETVPLENDMLYEWSSLSSRLSIAGGQFSNTVQVQVNNASGTANLKLKRSYCSTYTEDIIPVTIRPGLTPIIEIPDTICQGASNTFNSANIENELLGDWIWTIEGRNYTTNSATQTSCDHIFNNSGTIPVTLTFIPDSCSTGNSTTLFVEVRPGPDVSLSFISSVSGTTGTLYVTSQTGENTFLWSTGQVENSVTITAPFDSMYYCIVTNENGCSVTKFLKRDTSSDSEDVPVPGCSTLESSLDINVSCNTADFTYDSPTSDSTSYITWTITNNTSSPTATANPEDRREASALFTNAGIYTVRAREEYDNCEYFTYELCTIPIIPHMAVNHTCAANSTEIILNLQNISDFIDSVEIINSEWSINGVAVTPDANGDVTVPAVMNTIKLTVIYIYKHITDTCSVERMFDHARSVAGFTTSPTVYCIGTPIQFIDTSYAAISWRWTLGSGVTNLSQNPIQSFVDLEPIIITLQIQDHLGCTSSTARLLNIRGNNLAGRLAEVPGIYCSGEPWPVEYRYDYQMVSNVTYYWQPVNEMSNDRHHSFTQTGFYHVFLVDSSTSCQAQSNQINLLFANTPTAFISGNDSYCFDDAIKLYGNSGFDYNYIWKDVTTDNHITIATTPNLDIPSESWLPGTYKLRLTVSNGHCSASTEKEITIHEQARAPRIEFGDRKCIGEPPVILISSSGNDLYWSTGGYGPETNVYAHGFILAHYLDENGCKSKYGQIFVERSPSFDELLTGCFRVCWDGFPKYLTPPSGTFSNWEWLFNDQSILSGNNAIGSLPVADHGIYNLSIKYNGGDCTAISPDLVIESEEYCSCEIEMELLGLACKGVEECRLYITASILVTNLSSIQEARIVDANSSNGNVHIGQNYMGMGIPPNSSRIINLVIDINSLLSGLTTITINFLYGKVECEKEFIIDFSSILNDCTTDDCKPEFKDYSPHEELSNDNMLYYHYSISIGTDRMGIEVYSSDVIVVPPFYYDDVGGVVSGIFAITPARMREIIKNGEEICFMVKSCQRDNPNKICVKEVCFTPEFEKCNINIEITYTSCFVEDCEVYVEYTVKIINMLEPEISLVDIFSQVDEFLIQDVSPIPLHIAGHNAEGFVLRAISDPNLQQAELMLFFVNENGVYCQSTFSVPVNEIMKNCPHEKCEVFAESIIPNANLSNADYIYFDFILITNSGAIHTTVTNSYGYVTSHFYNPINGRIEGTVRVSIEEYLLLVGNQLCFDVKLCFSNHICTATTCFNIEDLGCKIEIIKYDINCGVDINGLFISIYLQIRNAGESTLTLTNIFLSDGNLSHVDYHGDMPEIPSDEIGALTAYFYLSNFESVFLNNVFLFETDNGGLCLLTEIIELKKYISPCIKKIEMDCIDFEIDFSRSTPESIYVEFALITIDGADLQAIYSSLIEVDHYTYDPVTGIIVVGTYLSGNDIENILFHNESQVCFTAYLLKNSTFHIANGCCEFKINGCRIKVDYKDMSCFVHNGELYIKLTELSVSNNSSMSYIFESILASHLELISITPSLPYTLYSGTFRNFDLIFKVENPEAEWCNLFFVFHQNGRYCWQQLNFKIKEVLDKYCTNHCTYQYNDRWNMNYSLSGNGFNYIDFSIEFLNMAGDIVNAEIYVRTDYQQIANIVNYTYLPNDNIIRGLLQVPKDFWKVICLVVYVTDNDGEICKMEICYDLSKFKNSPASGGNGKLSYSDDSPQMIKSEMLNSTDNLLSQKNIHLYPNPTNNTCAVNIDQSILKEITIFDLRGKEIDRHKSVEFSVANLAAGSYIVSVRMIDNTVRYLKLVKQ